MNNILSLSNYDIFEFPEAVRTKPPREWDRRQAEKYFRWFVELKPSRVAQILSVAGVAPSTPRGTKFYLITEMLRASMANLVEYEADVQKANGLGLVAGFDAALVLGDELVASVEAAKWLVMRTPIKTFISRNLPVVRRGTYWAFEPIWEGRSVLSLIGRENGKEPSNILATVFERWEDQLRSDPPSKP